MIKNLIYKIKIKKALEDNDIYLKEKNGDRISPFLKIKKDKNNDYLIKIENKSHYQDKLLNIDFSSAIKDLIFEKSYLTDNDNYVTVRLVKNPEKRQIKVDNLKDFGKIILNQGKNELVIDNSISFKKNNHILITGRTGAGKSVALQYLMLNYLLSDNVKYDIAVCDFKNSDTAILAEHLTTKYPIAVTIDDCLNLLDIICKELFRRQYILKSKKIIGLTSIDDGENGIIVFIDEYLGLISSAVTKEEKEKMAKIEAYIKIIALQGRSFGIFLCMTMQASPASKSFPTYLKEQMAVRVVLGNSDEQTYNTAFYLNASNKIPKRYLTAGAGWAISDEEREPRMIYFPFISDNFNRDFSDLLNRI